MHASVPCSKLNTDGDYGTSRKIPTHETLLPPPPEPDVSLLQPTNTTIPPPLIPPPSDFSSDYIPMVVPPPPPPADLLQTTPVQPNYIFINNINEFSGLPAAIRTANYVRPDRTSENFSEAFFDWENEKIKLPPTTEQSNPPPPSSFRYHLQTSEVQNIPSMDKSDLPEQSIETQYDLILEKETTPPPPLPKTPPPPLTEHPPIAVSKYFDLLTGKSLPPVPPPKPTPVTYTNTHAAGVSDEKNKWIGFSNAFSEKVIFCVCFVLMWVCVCIHDECF